MDKINNTKCISIDDYKTKKSNKGKFNRDKKDDLELIEKLSKIKFDGIKVVADVMDKIFRGF